MPEGYTFKEYDRGKGLKDICLKKMPGGIREYKKKKCLQEDAFDKRL